MCSTINNRRSASPVIALCIMTGGSGSDDWLKPGDSDDNSGGEHAGDADEGDISTFPPAFHPNRAKSGNKTTGILAVIPVKRIVV